MHVAVLVTNTADSALAARYPRDCEKFDTLIKAIRPQWQLSALGLPSGEFPADLTTFDGFIIGGSPASVNDDAGWMASCSNRPEAVCASSVVRISEFVQLLGRILIQDKRKPLQASAANRSIAVT